MSILPILLTAYVHDMRIIRCWFKIYLISMKHLPTVLLLLLLCLPAAFCIQCNASHFDFIGNYSLGKQDELNKTFIKIQEKITTLANVTYNATETTAYTIFNTKPVFYYRDSKQRAEITGNDTIIISGGFLEVDLTFDWQRTSLTLNRTGTGAAFGLSDNITFAKSAVIIEQGNFFSFELIDWEDVTWSNGEVFKLTKVDAPTVVTEEDKAALTRLLNNILKVKTVRTVLEEELEKYFQYFLRASLHDQHMPIDNHFDYKWIPGRGKPNVTIPFTRRAITVDIEEDGARLRFQVQVANYSDWKCGNRSVRELPLNARVYGHSQSFIGFDFVQNVVRYAVSKNILDSDLTRENWQSRMFQFYAGDLYEVLAKVQDRFFASQPVTGNCKATYTGLKVWKADYDTFNISIHFDCELNIQRTKILNFAVGLQAEVEGVADATALNFKFRRHEEFVSFYKYADYEIIHEDLGTAIVKHCLNRLYEGFLFGSGWPLSPPRDYPHLLTEENDLAIYDSTHIDPHLIDEEKLEEKA